MDKDVHVFQGKGFTLHYLNFGTGSRPLLILPGISCKSTMGLAGAVKEAYAPFAESWRVLLLDRRDRAPEGYSLEDMSDDAAALLEGLGLQSADVFGASQGGMIGQLLALRHPELVHKLVMGSSAAALTEESRRLFAEWALFARTGDLEALADSFLGRVYSAAYNGKYGRFLKAFVKETDPQELKQFRIITEACFGLNTLEKLGDISCPTLVLAGEEDRVLGMRASLDMAAAIPGAELYVYPKASHAVYDEDPEYLSRIKSFYEK